MTDGWADLVHDMTLDLGAIVPGQFVIVEHGAQLDPNPYVQAAPERGGGYNVSEHIKRYYRTARV